MCGMQYMLLMSVAYTPPYKALWHPHCYRYHCYRSPLWIGSLLLERNR